MLKKLNSLYEWGYLKKNLSKVIAVSLVLLILIASTNMEFIHAEITENNISEIIGNDDIIAIKKFEFDENDQVIEESIQDINPNTKGVNLADGTYLLNKGKGWVLNNDKSHVASGFANAGQTVNISKSTTQTYQHTIITGDSIELGFSKVKLAIEKTLEISMRESDSIISSFSVTAPSDKNLYLKTYTTYNRYDLVQVKNGIITGHSITYEPDGSWAKYITYKNGETVNQDAFKEKFDRSILGASSEITIDDSSDIYEQ